MVDANVISDQTGRPLLQPYVIKQIGGVPVAFIGATTITTPMNDNAFNVKTHGGPAIVITRPPSAGPMARPTSPREAARGKQSAAGENRCAG